MFAFHLHSPPAFRPIKNSDKPQIPNGKDTDNRTEVTWNCINSSNSQCLCHSIWSKPYSLYTAVATEIGNAATELLVGWAVFFQGEGGEQTGELTQMSIIQTKSWPHKCSAWPIAHLCGSLNSGSLHFTQPTVLSFQFLKKLFGENCLSCVLLPPARETPRKN